MHLDVCPNRWGLRKGNHYLEIWVLALSAGLAAAGRIHPVQMIIGRMLPFINVPSQLMEMLLLM